MKHVFVYTFLLINIVAAVAIGVASLSVFISPATFWIPALFGIAYPYLMVVNLAFIVFWIFIKPKFTILSLLVILAGFNHIGNYLQFSGKHTNDKGVRITTYNVRYFVGNTQIPIKENADHILRFLREDNADIICLQEVRLNKAQIFDINNTQLPHVAHMQIAHNGDAGGLLTMTSFPIIKMEEIRFENSGNMIMYADIVMNTSDTIRVYNCHLQSYKLGEAEIQSIDSLEFNTQPKTKKKVRELGHKFKIALVKRAHQAETLRRSIDKSPYPVIVCGDFNDTPVSYTYHTVKGNLKDSFTESGKGTANTYNGKLPSFRIDYILYSPIFTSFNFEVSNLNHSDHFPVSCDLFPAGK